MLKKSKEIPKFKSEDEERKFWEKNDSNDFLDWNNAKPKVLQKLKSSAKTISLCLSESMLEKNLLVANKRDVPY